MSTKTKNLIIKIERNTLTFWGGLFEKTVKLSFDESIFSDLEIVDKKVFIESVVSHVKNSESLTNLIIVFSDDVLFTKELPLTFTKDQIGQEEKTFLALIPFDKVVYKLIKFNDIYRFFAVNGDICNTLSEVLVSKGYNLQMVLPAVVIKNLDQNSELTESLKVYSLVEANKVTTELDNIKTTPRNNKLIILIGLFMVLLAILIIIVLRRL